MTDTTIQLIYKKAWTRSSDTYVIGLALGYTLHQRRREPEKFAGISKYLVGLRWVTSTARALLGKMDPFHTRILRMWRRQGKGAWHSRLYGAAHRSFMYCY